MPRDQSWDHLQPYQRPAIRSSREDGILGFENIRDGLETGLPPEKGKRWRWFRGTIDPSRVRDAFLVQKPFFPEQVASHFLVRFTFHPGGFSVENGQETDGLVISVESQRLKDQFYSIWKGFLHTYRVVWVLSTWKDYRELSGQVEGLSLIAHPFRPVSPKIREYLLELLGEASLDHSGEWYNSLFNNCYTNLLRIINRVWKDRVPFKLSPFPFPNPLLMVPTWIPAYLRRLGVLSPEAGILFGPEPGREARR